ncbi:NAD(P)/FAD-dependent oxidoreductase [Bailinhaonella thermotolerans]|uniref:NAD(P)/FAD-dependent oxidoreductase n=1 Tax=Bailinhaonella thermotolerans TaxID=1070861 RepID=UPI00192A284E|nr:NAD(P)/FAD-dependent oxidoreductase [Bailinhaonella thermotolerans]
MSNHRRILIVGGGHVGLYAALRLQRKLHGEIRRGEVALTLIDPQSYMTYQPFLPEAAAGNVEPRHVVVPLRRVLHRVRILNGAVNRIDHARHRLQYESPAGEENEIGYDVLVYCPGSVTRLFPIPGLAECGIGFKSVEEAISLRNHVLGQLDVADSTQDPEARRRALNFVFVGAGFSGVEALAELEDMARDACRYYPTIEPSDMRWTLIEATDRILPEVGPEMGRWALERLRERGIDVRLKTTLKSAENKHLVLSDGTEFDADTLVWTAGVRPHPLNQETDLPLDDKGRVKTTPYLTVEGLDDAFAAGDTAAVPDLTKPGEFTAPNAQHAVRQAHRLADNVAAQLRRRSMRVYRHAYAGSVASLGLHDGVANVYGLKVKGLPAWVMHRGYHLMRVPSFNRKTRVVADWTLQFFFRREAVSLGALQHPRRAFEYAAHPPRKERGQIPPQGQQPQDQTSSQGRQPQDQKAQGQKAQDQKAQGQKAQDQKAQGQKAQDQQAGRPAGVKR